MSRPDQEWNGWWGDNPPFRTPVFVRTHHPRPAVQMNGGTTQPPWDAICSAGKYLPSAGTTAR